MAIVLFVLIGLPIIGFMCYLYYKQKLTKCPKCGSIDTDKIFSSKDITNPTILGMKTHINKTGENATYSYKCNKCGNNFTEYKTNYFFNDFGDGD